MTHAARGAAATGDAADRGLVLTRDELVRWGREFGGTLSPPVILALEGELGAGKTTLSQAICSGVGIQGDVTSPTFALVNRYEAGDITVYHLDLYRLNSPADLTNLGWDEIANSESIVLVEWPERAGDRLPAEALRIRLEHIAGDPDRRLLRVLAP